MSTKQVDKARENKTRRSAKEQGYILRKSRARKWSIDNQQGYMVVNKKNIVAAGSSYDLSLDEVEAFLLNAVRLAP
jgi:hypothetical protein